jgi:hypothetical protein
MATTLKGILNVFQGDPNLATALDPGRVGGAYPSGDGYTCRRAAPMAGTESQFPKEASHA